MRTMTKTGTNVLETALASRSERLGPQIVKAALGMHRVAVLDGPVGFFKSRLLTDLPWKKDAATVQWDGDDAGTQGPWPGILKAATGHVVSDGDLALEELFTWAKNRLSPTFLIINNWQTVTSIKSGRELIRLTEVHPLLGSLVAGTRFSVLGNPLLSGGPHPQSLKIDQLGFTGEEVTGALEASNVELASKEKAWLSDFYGWPALLSLLVAHPGHFATGGEALEALLRQLLPNCRSDELLDCLAAIALNPHVAKADLQQVGLCPAAATSSDVLDSGLVQVTGVDGARKYHVPEPFRLPLREIAKTRLPAQIQARLRESHAARLFAFDQTTALEMLLFEKDHRLADHYLRSFFTSSLLASPQLKKHLLETPLEEVAPYPYLLALLLKSASQTPKRWPERSLAAAHLLASQITALMDPKQDDPKLSDTDVERLRPLLMVAKRHLGDYEEAVRLAEVCEEEIENLSSFPHGEKSLLPLLYSEMATTGLLAGNIGLTVRTANRGLTLAEAEGHHLDVALAHVQLAAAHLLGLDYEDAFAHYKLAAGTRGLLKPSGEVMCLAAPIAALLREVEGIHDEDGPTGLPLHENAFHTEYWPVVAILETFCMRLQEGSEAAYETLCRRVVEGQRRFPASEALTGALASRLTFLALASGHWHAVPSILEKSSMSTPQALQNRSRYHLLRGEHHEALSWAQLSQAQAGNALLRNEARLLSAAALYMAGDTVPAQEMFDNLAASLLGPHQNSHFSGVPFDSLLALAENSSWVGASNLVKQLEQVPQPYRMPSYPPLTDAELRALEALASDAPLSEIAKSLFISINTLKTQTSSIYRKLGVKGRKKAVVQGRKLGLIGLLPGCPEP